MKIPVWLKAEVTYSRTGSQYSSKTAAVVILGDSTSRETLFSKNELALIVCEIVVIDGSPTAAFSSTYGNMPGLDVKTVHFDLAGFLGMASSALLSYDLKICILSGGCWLSRL